MHDAGSSREDVTASSLIPELSSAWSELLSASEELVKRQMARYDPSHDWAHVQRVRSMAMSLAVKHQPRPDVQVVELAALFHDISDAKYTDTPLASTLDPLFAAHPDGISPRQMELIYRIIPCISWSTEKRMRAQAQWTEWHETCPELAVVQDADRLDAIGAVGVMRCAAYSGVKGRLLVASLVNGQEGGQEDTAEGHFYDKLLKIKDRMKTPAGREEALRRHQTMTDFLDALNREKIF